MSLTPGQEPDITVNGQTYRLARFERCYIPKWMKWATPRLPDPLAHIASKLKDLPADVQRLFAQEAVGQAGRQRNFDEPTVQALFSSEEGLQKMAAILLQGAQPELKEAEAEQIISDYVASGEPTALEDALIQAAGKKN